MKTMKKRFHAAEFVFALGSQTSTQVVAPEPGQQVDF